MKDFQGKVAVVTGAASGIGFAMAQRFAREGMKVVLADIEPGALQTAHDVLREAGADVLAVPADVASLPSVEALAVRAIDAFGQIDVLCCNAGVCSRAGLIWEQTPADWAWVFGVNVSGVAHCMQVFVPILLRQETEARIINTASMAGLLSGPFFGVYNATKAAVVSMSETLQTELSISTSGKVRVLVLCPGMVKTRIGGSERNRPDALMNLLNAGVSPAAEDAASPYPGHEAGMSAPEVAEIVLKALREDRFYILTHPEYAEHVRTRAAAIAGDRPVTARESREARMLRMRKSHGG